MTFIRDRLPDPVSYFEREGLSLKGTPRAKWKTTECKFHGGSDSMRINTSSGAWVCMAGCGAKGGDVLAYHIAAHGLHFIDAAKALGAWVEDGKPHLPQKATVLHPRAALEVLGFEATVVAVAAGNMGIGKVLSDTDRARLMICAGRINRIVEDFTS